MSLLTELLLVEKYGPLLYLDDMADVLNKEPGTIKNMVYAGTMPFRTTKEGKDHVAHYADVAAFIDATRERAKS